jgi:hydrogenase nickel insertion protein HypA
MHEYSITCSIVEILCDLIKKHNIKKIKKVSFEINPLAHIEPRSIEFYYNFITKDNKALKDSILEFKKGKIKIECETCGKNFYSENLNSKCIYCSGKKTKVADNDDLKIISIEA